MNSLNKCIVFEACIQNKNGYIISLRSPNQTHDEFEDLLLNFEQVLCDIIERIPFFELVTGDFSARAAKWWRNDTAIIKGIKIDSVTTSYVFSQIISDPTHTLPNPSSCIGFIFTNLPHLVIESGVYLSKFNLRL